MAEPLEHAIPHAKTNDPVVDIGDYLGTIEDGKVGGVNSSEEYIDEVLKNEESYTQEYLERVSN